MTRWLVALILVAIAASPLLGPPRGEIVRHLNGRHPERAQAAADRYIESFPGDPRGYFLRARARSLIGDRPGALADLERARALGGPRPEFLLEEYFLTGDRETALLLEGNRGRFLAGEPVDDRGTFVQAVWWAEEGRRRALAGREAEAEKAFDRSLELVPDLGRTVLYRALARGEIPAQVDLSNDAGFDVADLAELLMQRERPGLVYPDGVPWFLYYRGRALEIMGREEEAHETYRVCLKLLKKHPDPELRNLVEQR